MDEIRFQFWHTKLERMSQPYGLGIIYQNLCDEFDCTVDWNDIIKRQTTGIRDKYAVTIWKHDLIQNKSGRICKVVWNEFAACFDAEVFRASGHDNPDGFTCQQWPTWVEVVGNIYQNPELF